MFVEDEACDTIRVTEGIVSRHEHWMLQRELSLLDVEEEVLYRPFSTLSNGEQTKVLLATLFLKENHFLLIDEPTNHLDMNAREKVGQYLNSKKGFILVSHDRMFLDQCIDHILSINKNNIEIQKGNFSTWQQNKERQDRFELAENEKLKKEIKILAAAARRRQTGRTRLKKQRMKRCPELTGSPHREKRFRKVEHTKAPDRVRDHL